MSLLLEGLSDQPMIRSKQILSLVAQGKADMPSAIIETNAGKDLKARLKVSAKVMTIDGVRVSVNQTDLQHIADYYNGYVLTSKIAEEINKQADVRINPQNQPWYNDTPNSMGRLYRVFDYDKIVTEAIGNKSGKLYTNEGKDWVLDPRLFQYGKNDKTGLDWKDTAINHGWYQNDGSQGGGNPIQNLGAAHDIRHTDYSQLARIVFNEVEISTDGGQHYSKTTFSNVLMDPKLYKLVSYTRLKEDRHPGVERILTSNSLIS
jgi:hypothetical protein